MVGKANSHGLWLYRKPTLKLSILVNPVVSGYTESTAWIFPLSFRLHHLPGETCFQQARSSAVGGSSQAVLGSSDNRKVLASLLIFL